MPLGRLELSNISCTVASSNSTMEQVTKGESASAEAFLMSCYVMAEKGDCRADPDQTFFSGLWHAPASVSFWGFSAVFLG